MRDKNNSSRTVVVVERLFNRGSLCSSMQQLRVVRLLPNGIESAKHKINSSPYDREYHAMRAPCKWDKLVAIKGKRKRERKRNIYKVWNYIKHSRAVKEPTHPLFEWDEIANERDIYFLKISEREKWKFAISLFPVQPQGLSVVKMDCYDYDYSKDTSRICLSLWHAQF